MTEQQKETAQAVMFNDFRALDEIQNKIISAYEQMSLLRQLKDKSDTMFAEQEALIDLKIGRLTNERKGLESGKDNLQRI